MRAETDVLDPNAQESEITEFKREWSGKTKGLEDLAAFANTRGGSLLLGVDDDGMVVGFDPSDAQLRAILGEIVDVLGLHPAVQRLGTRDGRPVLELRVPPALRLVACRGHYYVRVGTTNRDMSPEELARRSILLSGQTWDLQSAGVKSRAGPGGADPDIDEAAVQNYLRLAQNRLPSARIGEDARAVLEKLELIHSDGSLTRAAVLLFGRNPQRVAVGARVRVGRFRTALRADGRGTETVIVGDHEYGGTLFEQLERVMDRLRELIEIRYVIEDPGPARPSLERLQRREVPEYPLEALREAVLNALTHRDYMQPLEANVRVYDDRIEVWNPGGLPEGITLESMRQNPHESRPGNRGIARAFYYAELIEKWGTGTTRMIEACRSAGLPEPEFSQDAGGVRVVFRKDALTPERLIEMGLNERQVKAVERVRSRGRIGNTEYQELTGASKPTATRDLDDLVKRGVLAKVGARGRATYYTLKGS